MLKLSITAIGVPKTRNTRNGPKEVNYIKATQYNDKFLNFWLGPITKDWKIGDDIEVLAVEESKYMGKDGVEKTSYDIKLPKTGNAELETRIKELEDSLQRTQDYIRETIVLSLKELDTRLIVLEPKKPSKVNGTELEYPGDEWMEGRDTNPDAF